MGRVLRSSLRRIPPFVKKGLPDEFKQKHLGSEYLGYATHEQYFYPEYFAYQPDYSDKILKAAEIIQRNGYEYFFAEEIVK